MEMPQEIFLCSYLKQAKCHFPLLFFLYKIREKESRVGLVSGNWCWWEQGEGGEMVEGRYGANTVYTLGKWKNNTC
jgi:hypothetical protein